jgi:3-deoxy-D-arabino-heptulosonate 7-phosphate (DAHP) synthase class II
MAQEPVDHTLRLLREIRAKQDAQGEILGQHGAMLRDHGSVLARVEKRLEDVYKMSTHTLGVAVTAHERYEALEARVEKLSERVERLESKA